MIDLAQTYEQAGLYLAPGELPDYLPAVLEFASTQPPAAARAFLGEMAHILNALFSALQQSAERLRQRARRAARTGRREGTGR
jgi:nitrate reductase delta subunit